MPKAEKGSIKDLGKRIKAKGLQKLKFYCQMCQKQCRDANGFKCHLTSESHLRQMKLFSENASGVMDQYSKEFENMFIDTLRMRHSTKEVNANNVYQQVIQDKQHIHMNATVWESLTDFVKYLGKKGKCHVKETERGWYISYIEKDVAKLARQEALQKRQQAEQAAEHALNERIEKQRIEAAKAYDRAITAGGNGDGDGLPINTEATNLDRSALDNETLKLSLQTSSSTARTTKKSSKKKKSAAKIASVFDDGDDDDSDDEEDDAGPPGNSSLFPVPPPLPSSTNNPSASSQQQQNKKKRSHQTEKEEEESSKKKRTTTTDDQHHNPATTWLHKDILVRIIDKKLDGGKYLHRKAAIDRIIYNKKDNNNNNCEHNKPRPKAEITILASGPNQRDGGDVLIVKEKSLETVIPKQVGKRVRILRGKYRGRIAFVKELNKKKYRAVLELDDDDEQQTIIDRIDYDDFSKIA